LVWDTFFNLRQPDKAIFFMKPVFFFALALLLCSLPGCSPYEVQFEGPYDDSQNPETNLPYEIMTLENGSIRLYNRNLSSSKTLSNLPAGIEKASINYLHNRIAYKVPGQNIAIVDSTGASIGVVANSAAAVWFDWHASNETLYILTGTSLSLWSPTISIPFADLSVLFPPTASQRTMPCAAVTQNGTIVVLLRYYAGSAQGYQSRIFVVSPTDSSVQSGTLGSNEEGQWLRIDPGENRILFGTRSTSSTFSTRRLNLAEGNISVIGAWPFAVSGPLESQTAIWQNNNFIVNYGHPDGDYNFNTNVVGITALDW